MPYKCTLKNERTIPTADMKMGDIGCTINCQVLMRLSTGWVNLASAYYYATDPDLRVTLAWPGEGVELIVTKEPKN